MPSFMTNGITVYELSAMLLSYIYIAF